jgi:hypothetical protein
VCFFVEKLLIFIAVMVLQEIVIKWILQLHSELLVQLGHRQLTQIHMVALLNIVLLGHLMIQILMALQDVVLIFLV